MRAVSGERRAESGDLESGEQKCGKNRKYSSLNLEFTKIVKKIPRIFQILPKIEIFGTYFRGMCGH
jgi:hypothetical protein